VADAVLLHLGEHGLGLKAVVDASLIGCPFGQGKTIGIERCFPQDRPMLSETQRRFVEISRIGHLATADASGAPYLVPVCYGLGGETLYITIDEKPKRRGMPLKRVRNIIENPRAAFIVDRYDEDWTRLGWVMLRGAAEILDSGEGARPRPGVASRQICAIPGDEPDRSAVIALRIAHVASWGDLSSE